jgi:hypothetical protein
MSEDPKTATGLIVKEIADMVPPADKAVAGQDFGTRFGTLVLSSAISLVSWPGSSPSPAGRKSSRCACS